MNRDRRRSRELRLECLEGKQLLSTVRPAVAISSPTLNGGMTAGGYQVSPIVGASQSVKIALAGQAGAMGNVTGVLTEGVDTSLEVVARANLKLTNAQGSVTLNLTHLDITKNLTKPFNMGYTADYTVVASSGAYSHAHGTGTIDVTPTNGDLVMRVALASA